MRYGWSITTGEEQKNQTKEKRSYNQSQPLLFNVDNTNGNYNHNQISFKGIHLMNRSLRLINVGFFISVLLVRLLSIISAG
jgi:hypothetical protein